MAIDQNFVPGCPAEQSIGWDTECFSSQIPQGDVYTSKRRLQHGPAPPERTTKDVLPYMFDSGCILTHQDRFEMMLQRADNSQGSAAERGFSNSVYSLIGFDLDIYELIHSKYFKIRNFHRILLMKCSSLHRCKLCAR